MSTQRNFPVSYFQRAETPSPRTRLCYTGITFTSAFVFTTDVIMDEEETACFRIDSRKKGVANTSITHSQPLLPQV